MEGPAVASSSIKYKWKRPVPFVIPSEPVDFLPRALRKSVGKRRGTEYPRPYIGAADSMIIFESLTE